MGEIESLLDRPRRYSNVDGMVELGCGFFCLGIGIFEWLVARSPQGSVWHKMSFFIFAGLVCAVHFGVKAIKERVTYRRTGFVEQRRGRASGMAAAVCGGLTAAGLSVALRRHWEIATPAALLGLAFAASYAYQIARAVPWKWIVTGAIVAGSLAIAVLPADVLAGAADGFGDPARARLWGTVLVSLMVYGGILLVSGSISFGLYLRHTEPARESE